MSQFENPYAFHPGGHHRPADLSQSLSRKPIADLGKRFLGAIVDAIASLVFALPGIVLGILSVALYPNAKEPPPLFFVAMGLMFLGMVALGVLQIYMLATRSQTVGKYVIKTQIYDIRTGQPASFVNTFLLRGLVNGIICSIPCIGSIYAIVDICFIFGQQRRCVHDLIANTIVVDIAR